MAKLIGFENNNKSILKNMYVFSVWFRKLISNQDKRNEKEIKEVFKKC